MKVTKIQSAVSGDVCINLITVETKGAEPHVFTIELVRPYNIAKSGPTDQDIAELVTLVYEQEHRDLQTERIIRSFNRRLDAYLETEAGIAQTQQQQR